MVPILSRDFQRRFSVFHEGIHVLARSFSDESDVESDIES